MLFINLEDRGSQTSHLVVVGPDFDDLAKQLVDLLAHLQDLWSHVGDPL